MASRVSSDSGMVLDCPLDKPASRIPSPLSACKSRLICERLFSSNFESLILDHDDLRSGRRAARLLTREQPVDLQREIAATMVSRAAIDAAWSENAAPHRRPT